MSIVGWLLLVGVGIALGYGLGRRWPGSAEKITHLERERDAAREDLAAYRRDVSSHFERTAQLFDKVTADYRGLYEHLAQGSRQLSAIRGEAIDAPLVQPEGRRLAAITPPREPADAAPPESANREITAANDSGGEVPELQPDVPPEPQPEAQPESAPKHSTQER
jgi:uncharacterized protein